MTQPTSNTSTRLPKVPTPLSSAAPRRTRAGWAWLRGILGLGIVVWLMGFTKLEWPQLVTIWVVGTLLLAEIGGGWFAYLAIPAGWLVFMSDPKTAKDLLESWWIISPVVSGSLWLYLLLRNSATVYALPLAAGGFVVPWYVYKLILPKMDDIANGDPMFKLLIGRKFQQVFFKSLALGVGLVLAWYLLGFLWTRRHAIRTMFTRAKVDKRDQTQDQTKDETQDQAKIP